MCTAVAYRNSLSLFGRNLDLDRSYGERVVITPRNFEFKMRCSDDLKSHCAMIGMAAVIDGYPLYFEATNEKGLSMAGLNFPDNAHYFEKVSDKENIAPFELIPKILGLCENISEAKKLISNINIANIAFSDSLPTTPLHWMISDKEKSLVLESTKDGLKIYDNPFEVLTNNPPFDFHIMNMNNYMGLSAGAAVSAFDGVPLANYSLGMGALGLPGDFSSASRFVRAFFVKENSISDGECVNQFFHIMSSVSMPKGCVKTEEGFEYTRYTSCCDLERGIYYYTTYKDPTVRSVHLFASDLEGCRLYCYEVDDL